MLPMYDLYIARHSRPHLAEELSVPGTSDWERAEELEGIAEPLFQYSQSHSPEEVKHKSLVVKRVLLPAPPPMFSSHFSDIGFCCVN